MSHLYTKGAIARAKNCAYMDRKTWSLIKRYTLQNRARDPGSGGKRTGDGGGVGGGGEGVLVSTEERR